MLAMFWRTTVISSDFEQGLQGTGAGCIGLVDAGSSRDAPSALCHRASRLHPPHSTYALQPGRMKAAYAS